MYVTNNKIRKTKMNLNLINEIISNEKSRELVINIIVDGKVYMIDTMQSDFENGVLKLIVIEKQ
jgi:hypothetical protein